MCFVMLIKAQVQILYNDNGEEYMQSKLQQFLVNKGIVHKISCSNTPKQNGVTKWNNLHLLWEV